MNSIDELVRSLVSKPPADDGSERVARDYARRGLRREMRARTPGRARVQWRVQRFVRPRLAAALATAVAIGALLVAAFLPGREANVTRLGPAPASAAIVLERAATSAARQPWHPLRAGEYDYLLHIERYPGDESIKIDETWVAGDSSGRELQRPGPAEMPSMAFSFGAAKPIAIPGGGHEWRQPFPFIWPAGSGPGLDYQQLIRLTTDPAALKRWIETQNRSFGNEAPREDFTVVGDIMRLPAVPPKLRAAMYRVVARLPHVVLVGAARDELGRRGIAVGFRTGGWRDDLIFDPATGTLLGERNIWLGRPMKNKGWVNVSDGICVRIWVTVRSRRGCRGP